MPWRDRCQSTSYLAQHHMWHIDTHYWSAKFVIRPAFLSFGVPRGSQNFLHAIVEWCQIMPFPAGVSKFIPRSAARIDNSPRYLEPPQPWGNTGLAGTCSRESPERQYVLTRTTPHYWPLRTVHVLVRDALQYRFCVLCIQYCMRELRSSVLYCTIRGGKRPWPWELSWELVLLSKWGWDRNACCILYRTGTS